MFGYVVTPEHVHLLVSEPEIGLLADALKALKLSVSLRSSEVYPSKSGGPWIGGEAGGLGMVQFR